MPVLLALSILAFVALVWATISIAGTVRRARRRKRRQQAESASVSASAAVPVAAPTEPIFYADPEVQSASPKAAAIHPPDVLPPFVPLEPLAALEQAPPPEHAATVPVETVTAEAIEPPPLPYPTEPPPPRLRVFPTRLGKHPVAAAAESASPTWNPFREEYGDLSDPAPRRRVLEARARKNRGK